MNINFSTYNAMIAWPNPHDGDMGIIDLINKTYTYKALIEKWICSDQDKNINVTKSAEDGATGWTPTIGVNEYTTLNNISSSMTSLIISMGPLPDSYYSYGYAARFVTPATLGITTFKVVGPGYSRVAVSHDLSSRIIKFSASQLNHIYATLADQTIVTGTASISYVTATSTLSVGAETLILNGASTDDVYFVCSGGFGVVTAVGTEFDVPTLYDNVTWMGTAPSLEASKTYEISVLNGLAIISGSV